MEHIAIMKKAWGLTEKILTGEKTVESRWYKTKHPPWGRIASGDTIYFKDSGDLVSVKARIAKVLQFDGLNSRKTEEILTEYGQKGLGTEDIMPEIRKYVSGKKYCILVFFEGAEKIKPFKIDKTGFGTMSAWISIDNIDRIKI